MFCCPLSSPPPAPLLPLCVLPTQVRLCELPQGAGSASVSKSLLGQHYSRAHKLALDPLCPAHCFYSCGEDGLVRRDTAGVLFLLRGRASTTSVHWEATAALLQEWGSACKVSPQQIALDGQASGVSRRPNQYLEASCLLPCLATCDDTILFSHCFNETVRGPELC